MCLPYPFALQKGYMNFIIRTVILPAAEQCGVLCGGHLKTLKLYVLLPLAQLPYGRRYV